MAEEPQSQLEDDVVTVVKLPDAPVARPRPDAKRNPPASGRAPAAFGSRAPGNESALVEASGLAPEVIHDGARYAEREVLGEGGMGKIFLCHDERVGRDVAMKVLRTK
jgi:serine/threonine protein kinase